MLRDGMKSISKLGVCPESEWRYDIGKFRERPTPRCYTGAANHQALVYRRVNQDLHQVQGCLAAGSPVVFGFSVYESFESGDVARTGSVPLPGPTEELLGGHAAMVVGYDDASQSFLVRNSWGPDWGDGGYCTMPYGYLTSRGLAADFWVLYTVEG